MPRQIGWSQESNLLYNISMQLDRLAAVTAAAGGGGGGTITGGGAAGQITFWNGATSITGSNNLFWDNTNLRLGIQTNTPQTAIEIAQSAGRLRFNQTVAGSIFQGIEFATSGSVIASILANQNTGEIRYNTITSYFPTFYASGAEAMRLSTARNLLIGTITDNGARLQVSGDLTMVSGSIFNNFYGFNYGLGNTKTFTQLGTTAGTLFLITSSIAFTATGNQSSLVISNSSFAPTSGTGTYNVLELGGTINQTGTATGITRSLLISPALTSAINFRAIEWTNNTGWGLFGNGTAPNYLGGDLIIAGKLALTVVTNRQTVNYSLVLADNGKLVEMNVGAANTLTVPPNSSIAFPIGTKIDIAQYGAGQTSIVPGAGVTVRSALGALKLAAQYSGASLVKIGTDEWYLFGDITV